MSSTRKPFEYKPRTHEQLREQAENSAGRKFDSIFKKGFDLFRPLAGRHCLRILPATWDGAKHYGFEVHIHQYIGPNNCTYLCPERMKNERCPVCDMVRTMKERGEDKETIKQFDTRTAYICWVIDRNDKDEKTKMLPKLWQMSWTLNQEYLLLATASTSGPPLNIDDPEAGFDINFTREGKGKNDTKYVGRSIERYESPISKDDKDYWKIIDFIQDNPVPDTLNFYDFDHLKNVITGKVIEADEDEGDDDDHGAQGAQDTRETDSRERPSGQRERPRQAERETPRQERARSTREEPQERDTRSRGRQETESSAEDTDEGDRQEAQGEPPQERRRSRSR